MQAERSLTPGLRAPRVMLVVTVDDVRRQRDTIAAALAAGIDTLQLRDRRAGGGPLFAAATELRTLTRTSGAALLVNDRIDVARAAAADGVHLPATSLPIAAARALLGPAAWIGRSTHAPVEAVAAARSGADYVVLGPIYPTPSKAQYGAPLGVGALTAVRVGVPLIAIGGVTPDHVADLRRAGARGVAVVRAVLDAPDPHAAAGALVRAFGEAESR